MNCISICPPYYSPSGDGKIPYIDPRDVAAVAFVTLTQPGHLGKTYVLTGSEAISYRQASEIIGAAIGKKLRFVDESPEQARARRIREGVPPSVIESILAIGAYQRAGGKTVTITNTVADLTGCRREPLPSSFKRTLRSSVVNALHRCAAELGRYHRGIADHARTCRWLNTVANDPKPSYPPSFHSGEVRPRRRSADIAKRLPSAIEVQTTTGL
jgi:hypothetical protein